jgi:hypothetical protein
MSYRADVAWQHPETGETFRVALDVTPPQRARGWDPGDPGECEVVEVCEDCPGGAERPDLIEMVERDIDLLEEQAFAEADEYDGPDTMEAARGER